MILLILSDIDNKLTKKNLNSILKNSELANELTNSEKMRYDSVFNNKSLHII